MTPESLSRLAAVAAAAVEKGVLARVAPAVEDVHLEINGQRWVVWPVNGWWATRLDDQLGPLESAGYIGPESLDADEVIARTLTGRFRVGPFDDTPLVMGAESASR